ncbi:unnamed protein product [Parajaminaea phylloscopi]
MCSIRIAIRRLEREADTQSRAAPTAAVRSRRSTHDSERGHLRGYAARNSPTESAPQLAWLPILTTSFFIKRSLTGRRHPLQVTPGAMRESDGGPVHLQAAAPRCATFRVGGMTCGACVESIESMLRKQAGIESVSVALLAEQAVVKYNPDVWNVEKLVTEIEDIGFDAACEDDDHVESTIPEENHGLLAVYGMTCSACVASIEQAVKELSGVIACDVALATERASVRFDAKLIGLRDIVERIEDAGFDVVVADDRDSTQLQSLSRVKEVTEWRKAFLASLSMAVPVFLISMVLPKFPPAKRILMWQPITQLYLTDIICLCLTIPVQFGIGRRFYRAAWKALKHKSATMDVLVVFGTTASFTYSAFSMLIGLFYTGKPATFFDTSTMLITFVSLGRYLENTAKGKTSEALSRLIRLSPTTAIIYSDGKACSIEKRVPGELVQKGDYVKVVPGERIPADGVVIRGSSTIDESVVTGESMPVVKMAGSQVIGGTVNGSGTFDFLVQKAGKDTSLAQIVRLVSEAQTSKAPIQAFADRIAGIFVPTVIALGLLTFFSWMLLCLLLGTSSLPDVFQRDQSNFAVCLKLCISVVVVACPCALGLATPTAVMVGTGVGAQNGILIKGGGPLEASVKVRKVLFDKTGTLTKGKVALVASAWAQGDQGRNTVLPDLSQEEALEVIGVLEKRSEHPLATAIVSHAAEKSGIAMASFPREDQAMVESFQNSSGQGISGLVRTSKGRKHQVSVGNASLCGVPPPSIAAFAQQQERQARTLVYASIDNTLVCAFALSDEIKAEARSAIAALQAMRITVGLVTGDTEATARAVAKEVGIPSDEVYASRSPLGKSELVAQMRLQSGEGVAFVGDGINDSPALATADAGIALSSGSDIALDSASIVLVRDSLLDVPAALLLARRIFLQIRLNFAWATCYNLVALPLAMGFGLPWGWRMHPMMAGAAMAASSVSVVCASLTLKWWKKPAQLSGGSDALLPEMQLEPKSPPLLSSLRQLMPSWTQRRQSQAYQPLPAESDAMEMA